jgi:hypothetical protein
MLLGQVFQLFRGLLFQSLQDYGQSGDEWFIGQEVNVLRHQNISHNDEAVALAYTFQFMFEGAVCVGGVEEWESSVTTEGYEVELA